MPFESTDIRLVGEKIDIYLYREYYEVKVHYEFFNDGDDQSLTIGFPVVDSYNPFDWIDNFTAFENQNIPLNIETIESEVKDYSRFFCFTVTFNKLQKKVIKNQYKAHYDYDTYAFDIENSYLLPAGYRGVSYILKTGAYWKDKISSVEVYFHFMYLTSDDLQDKYDDRVYKALYIHPNVYEFIDKRTIRMSFTDIEPDFNIKLFFNTLRASVGATSELKEGDYIYRAINTIDGDPATAWVEGVGGSGINERIIFAIGPIYSKEPGSYLVEKIGIMNGLCKNSLLFYKNNRVKKARLVWYSHYEERPERAGDKANSHERIIELSDTMQMQFIQFDEPVRIYEFSLEILDVYRGSAYDDTCLSELKVFYYIPAE